MQFPSVRLVFWRQFKNYWCRSPIQSNRLLQHIYTVPKNWFYKYMQWEIQGMWPNSCISYFSLWNLLRIQPNEDWQCHIVVLLFPTLLSLLFLTSLWHTNTCSFARMFFWTLSRRVHGGGILRSSVSLQLFNTTEEPMM